MQRVCEYITYINHDQIGSVICFTGEGFYLVDKKKNIKYFAGCMFPIIYYNMILFCIYIRIKKKKKRYWHRVKFLIHKQIFNRRVLNYCTYYERA